MWDHARVYARQVAFLPGVATAMLYLTVLSFHIVMVSYLLVRTYHTIPIEDRRRLKHVEGRCASVARQ
jgi:hypothetical protein